MPKVYPRVLFTAWLCAVWVFTAQAQNPLQVTGPQDLCVGECGTWTVQGSGTTAGFLWTIYSITPPADTVLTTLTNGGTLTWCPPFGNTGFRIVVTTPDVIGGPANSGGTVVFVSEQTGFLVGEWSYESDCETIPIILEGEPNQGNCIQVCTGSTGTLVTENTFIITNSGGTAPVNPSLATWAVSGGAGVSAGNNLYSVTWGPPGLGQFTYTAIAFIDNQSNCDVYASTSVCFDILPAPTATITTQPPAAADGVLTICEGQAVFFSGAAADATQFGWDFGDGARASGASVSHTFATAGVYDVSLVASSTCDCADTTRLTVVVTGNDAPFVDCVATICAGTAVTYTANTGCSSYLWTIGPNGLVLDGGGPSDDFVTVQWSGGPVGEIALDTDGCPNLSQCTETAYLQVPIVDDQATINGPARVCPGERAVYSITPFEGTSFTWTVSGFGQIVAGQGTPSVTIDWFDGFLPSQDQWVRVTYDNCYLGCGGADELAVRIRPPFLLSGPLEVCADGSGSFAIANAITNAPFPALWSVLDAAGNTVWTSPGAGAGFSIPFAFGAGEYVVRAVPQTPENFCGQAAERRVTVYPTPPAVTSVVGQTTICPGLGYTYEVADAQPGERYRWVITDGPATLQQFGRTVVHAWGPTPPYSLAVTRIQRPPLDCESVATTLAINPVGAYQIIGNDQVCADQVSTYTTDLSGQVNFLWSILPASAGTITGDPTAVSIEVLWHEVGANQVILEICGQVESLPVDVNAPPMPTVLHPLASCPGEMALVQTSTPFVTYTWQDTVGNLLSAVAQPSLGPGYYRLEVTDALGCSGDTTFSILSHPPTSVRISTPDFTAFCNTAPNARLFAINSQTGFTYQWLHDGMPVGANSPGYTATALGAYQVEVTDANGCTAGSNVINLVNDCGAGGGAGPPLNGNCPDPTLTFNILPGAFCNERAYQPVDNGATGYFWSFDDPSSGATNTSTTANATHTYTAPGFYRVLLLASYPGGTCGVVIPDTVTAAARFTYEGVCPGSPVRFFDVSTYLPPAAITAWEWDFGDPASGANNTANIADPTHVFSGVGTYPVTLTITTSSGCQSRITQDVTLFPLPTVAFSDPVINCAATALPFVADVAETVSGVSWDFGDPASGLANASGLRTGYHAYAVAGNYDVRLTATSVYGCTNTTQRTVMVTPNTLTGNITPPGLSQVCAGDSLLLTAPVGGSQWLWSNDDTLATTQVREAGVYTLTLTDASGCAYTPPAITLNVVPAPSSPIRAVFYDENEQPTGYRYDSLTVCFGQDVFLETPLNANYTYVWQNGQTTPAIAFTDDRGNLLPAGVHEITLTVTESATGCTSLETFTVTVHPSPEIPLLSTAAPAPLCAGTATILQVSNPAGDVTYLWSNGDTGPAITTTAGGRYRVRARNTFGCLAESEPLEILAGPNISLVPNGCHTRCRADTLCLPVIPDVVSYQWYLDGQPIPPANGVNPNVVIDQSGSYTLEMIDINGCVQTTNPLQLELLDGFGDILGAVYFDLNEDGVIDPTDSLAANVGLVLTALPGLPIDSIRTDSLGNYGFVNIPAADYTVGLDTFSLPAGWRAYQVAIDTSIVGCAQEVTLQWLLYPFCETAASAFTASVCPGETYTYQGQPLAAGSMTMFTLQSFAGCDSVVTVTVEALPTATGTLALQACPGSTVAFGGQDLAVGSITDFTLTAANGCDSVLTVTVEALPTATGTLALQACPGSTVAFGGQDLAVGSITDFTLTAANGCDSVLTVTVTALPTATGALALQACPGSTVAFGGQDLAVGSITDFTLTAANGCDSVLTVTVEALPTATGALALQACPGSTVAFGGQDLAVGSITDFTLTAANGCDSVLTVTVEALPTATGALALQACPGSTVAFGGQDLAVGSITDFTLTAANGCDSVLTVTVTALTPTITSLQETVCPGNGFEYLGTTYGNGTDTTFVFTDVNGCDSLVQLQVLTSATAVVVWETTASCPDAASGSITALPQTGAQPFRYQLAGGELQDSPQFAGLTGGSYTLEVTDANGCNSSWPVDVLELPELAAILPDALLPCDGSGARLAPEVLTGDDGNLQYRWADDGNATFVRTVAVAGRYRLQLANGCETLSLVAEVTPERSLDPDRLVYIPSAFSPNDDGVNDVFKLYPAPDVQLENVEFQVFDRWGNQVFVGESADAGWVGKFRGQISPSVLYVWWLRADVTVCGQQLEIKRQGEVMLVR